MGVVSLSSIASLLGGAAANAAEFAGGDGSVGDPYQIANCVQLQAMETAKTSSFVLANDIDCSDTVNWNGGQGFIPIAKSSNMTGNFNGQSHAIFGLTIHSTTDNTGLFGHLNSATTVKDVSLVGGAISGTNYVGALAGNSTADLQGIRVAVPVTGTGDHVGGIEGYGYRTSVVSSGNTAAVTGRQYVGGLVGDGLQATLSKTYSTGAITGDTMVGGLIGQLDGNAITDSTSKGSVTGVSVVGGLVGLSLTNNTHMIQRTYSTAAVTATDATAGGLIGQLDLTGTNGSISSVTSDFAAGSVTAGTSAGGVFGQVIPIDSETTPTFVNLYFGLATTGQNDCIGDGPGDCSGIGDDGEDADYFKSNANNLPLSQWDFADTWSMATGEYPSLVASQVEEPVLFPGGTGEVDDPYQINTCTLLQAMQTHLNASYVLTADIDCSDTVNWNGGKGFVPVGQGGILFTGSLDGAGFEIQNLTIIRADELQGETVGEDESFVGLFGHALGATISDVHIVNSKVKGFHYVGGIVGWMDGGTMNNSSFNIGTADNSCNPGHCVWARYGQAGGGLVGEMTGGAAISNSQTAGPVKGSGNVIGGLVGVMEDSTTTVTDSSSTSNIDGGQYLGGAVGQMNAGSLLHVHASGSIDANTEEDFKSGTKAGGLVGSVEGGEVAESYATGNITAELAFAGGLIGYMSAGSVHDAYATGDATAASTFAGGFVGSMDGGSIETSYASGFAQAPGGLEGSFVGQISSATISNSFAVGEAHPSASPAGFAGEYNAESGAQIAGVYYDQTTTIQTHCANDISGQPLDDATVGCSGTTTPNYFIDYRNAPFTQESSRVWTDPIWYFDGTHLPVLRTNDMPSVTPGQDAPDTDHDGIADSVENAAPNSGDANYDGQQDGTQSNVASFVNTITGKYVVLEVPSICQITSVAMQAQSTSAKDAGFSYPAGLMAFTTTCSGAQPGFTLPILQYYYGLDAANLVLRKYNETTGSYQKIEGATVTSGTGFTQVTYGVRDGGPLDQDGQINGTIVDPAGLALPAASIIPGVPNTAFASLAKVNQATTLILIVVVAVIGAVIGVRERYVSHRRR